MGHAQVSGDERADTLSPASIASLVTELFRAEFFADLFWRRLYSLC
jgi:hypothetical protein